MNEPKNPLNVGCATCSRFSGSMFQNLTGSDLEKISSGKSCISFKKGSVFIQEGTRPNGVFCMHSGKVKVYKHGDGREQIIRIAKEGDLLGYKAILAEEPFPVSAEALEDCTICFVPKPLFLETLFTSSSFAQHILREACRELELMTSELTNMAQKTVRERVALTLLMLSDTYGEDALEPGRSTINLKREDLAGLVGTATETLIRLLSELKEEKLIEIEGRRVIVRDKAGLKRAARLY
jgi:CRP/FNR family transcriptional regulator